MPSQPPSPPLQRATPPNRWGKRRGARLLAAGLGGLAIALLCFHAVSTLVFAVLGLAPSSPQWWFVPVLGTVLATSGATAIAPRFRLSRLGQRLAGLASGGASGAILGFFYLGRLSGQQMTWAIAGAIFAGLLFGGLAAWTSLPQSSTGAKRWLNAMLVIMANICAYGFAFGSGAWFFAAASTGHWLLAIALGILTLLYLGLTRQLLGQLIQLLR